MNFLQFIALLPLFLVPQEVSKVQTWQEMLDERPVLKALAVCESQLNINAFHGNDGKKGVHSYGLFQFQLKTAIDFNSKYKILPFIEDSEMMNVIYDPKFQIKLADKAIKDGKWRHWYTCSKRVGLDS